MIEATRVGELLPRISEDPEELALQAVQPSREVLAMSTLNEAVAKRIGTLVRMLGSNFEGEGINAATEMRRLLPSEGLTFNDIAT